MNSAHGSKNASSRQKVDDTGVKLKNKTIPFEEFKILTAAGNIQSVDFKNATIIGKNGNKAALEKILKCVPDVEKITWHHEIPSFHSATNASEIRLPKLKEFKLIYNPNNFDLTTFLPFMINHDHATFDLQTEKPTRSSVSKDGIRLLERELLCLSDSEDSYIEKPRTSMVPSDRLLELLIDKNLLLSDSDEDNS